MLVAIGLSCDFNASWAPRHPSPRCHESNQPLTMFTGSWRAGSSGLLPPSPPAEKATASKDEDQILCKHCHETDRSRSKRAAARQRSAWAAGLFEK